MENRKDLPNDLRIPSVFAQVYKTKERTLTDTSFAAEFTGPAVHNPIAIQVAARQSEESSRQNRTINSRMLTSTRKTIAG